MRRGRRFRHTHSTEDFAQLAGAEQLAHLEHVVDDVRAATYAAIWAHTGQSVDGEGTGDPLDAVATANGKYELAQQNRLTLGEPLDLVGSALRSLVRLAKAQANLRDALAQQRSGDLAAASSLISEAQTLLGELQGSEAAAAEALRGVLVERRADLRCELEYVGERMYSVGEHAVAVQFGVERAADGTPYESPVAPGDLFFALGELGLAAPLADSLADGLAALVLHILRHPHAPVALDCSPLGATLSIGRFAATKPVETADAGQTLVQVREKCALAVEFVQTHVFHAMDGDELSGMLAYVGGRMWRLVGPAMRDMVVAQPDGAPLDQLVRCEDTWVDAGLLAPEHACVRGDVRDLVHARAARRRRDLLAHVTGILAADAGNTTAVGGSAASDAKGKAKGAKGSGDADAQPACVVSVRAQALVDFAHATLALGAEGEGAAVTLAQQYLAVRDALVLFRALLAASIDAHAADRRAALVAASDCEYVARSLSTLGFAGRTRPPSVLLLRQAALVDVLAAYRALGRRALAPVASAARRSVRLALSGVWTPGHGEPPATVFADEERLAAVVLACGVVERLARDACVLPDELRLGVLGRVVAEVLAHVCPVVRRLVDARVPGAAARGVRRALDPLVRLPECFCYAHATEMSGRTAPVQKYCAEWDGFLGLVGRLDALSSGIQP